MELLEQGDVQEVVVGLEQGQVLVQGAPCQPNGTMAEAAAGLTFWYLPEIK